MARTTGFYLPLRREDNGSVGEQLNRERAFFAEPSLFTIFSIPIVAGDTKTPLEKPATLMISDAAAERYFGTQDVVGERLQSDERYFEITGVYEAFPPQSHWHPDFLVAFSTLNDPEVYGREQLETDWSANNFMTYILVSEEFDPARTEAQFPDFLNRHMGSPDNPTLPSTFTNLFLQPLTAIHLHSQLDSELEANGNINHVYIMGAIGVFLLLIACFNFINLSTARAISRGKEVGLRKVVGAFRRQLIAQHLSESILVALFAFLVAIVLVSLALPWLNDFTDKSLAAEQFMQPVVVLGVLGAVVLVGILAGLYPAFIISGFKPATVLKGRSGSTGGSGRVRKVLVVMQFTVSIVMIIATLITYQQLNYLNDRDLGYTKDQVVLLNNYYLRDHYEAFYNELTQHPTVINASRSSHVPTERLTSFGDTGVQQGDSIVGTELVMKDVLIDPEYFSTYEIPIVSGRNFSEDIASDDSTSFILNETAVRMVGWTNEEAVGRTIANRETTGTVVGVVQDFHFESLHQPIVPMIFNGNSNRFYDLSVRVAAADMTKALAHMETTWKQFVPDQPFNYEFLSESYRHLYNSERSQNELFIIFASLAIFIAAMGLFGLATFSTQQRTKEVSIRKVLGAPVSSILRLLSQEIIILILIANLIAWPIAWYAMREWLSGFAYHVEMSVLTYLLAAVLALVITLITISSQTVKTALTNPATILRND
jgi:putative ABC transport system permease protein